MLSWEKGNVSAIWNLISKMKPANQPEPNFDRPVSMKGKKVQEYIRTSPCSHARAIIILWGLQRLLPHFRP